jgi:hypothetical protein
LIYQTGSDIFSPQEQFQFIILGLVIGHMAIALPAELWIQILDLATTVPSELNSDAVSIFERCTHIEAQRARQAILPTRRALPLVSKTFYNLANKFLYQSILIRRGETIMKLIRTFEEASARAEDGEAGSTHPGRWTRRLDIDVPRLRSWSKVPCEEIFHLLTYTPNVEFFVGFGPWNLSDDRLLITGLQTCRNLKLLFLPAEILPKYESAMFELVTTKPLSSSLHIFYPNFIITSSLSRDDQCNTFFTPDQGAQMVAITASDAWLQGHAAADPNYFPHLRTMHIFGVFQENFLRTHGHKITTLDLEVSPWELVLPYQHYFPNLRDIIIDLETVVFAQKSNWSVVDHTQKREIKKGGPTMPRVRRVGLTVNTMQARHSWFTAAFTNIPHLFPEVRHLRILERGVVDLLGRQQGRVQRWHQALIAKNVRLEREDGELLIEDRRQTIAVQPDA